MKYRPNVNMAYRAIGKVPASVKKREEERKKEEQKEKYIKILAKDKDGVTLLYPKRVTELNLSQKVKTSWEEFNRIYEIRDNPFQAWLKPEVKEVYNTIDEILTDAIPLHMRVQAIENGSKEREPNEKDKTRYKLVMLLSTASIELEKVYKDANGKITADCSHLVMEMFFNKVKVFYKGVIEMGGSISPEEISKFLTEKEAEINQQNAEKLKAAN